MSMTLQERAVFLQRCREFFQSQKDEARAAGKCLPYRLDDVQAVAEKLLARPVCPYCHAPCTAGTFAFECKIPANRGGRYTLRNLQVCCQDCLTLKGVLDCQEFTQLWMLIRTLPKPVQKNFLMRLRAGAPFAPPILPRPGSLEWFTGSDTPHPPAKVRG